MFDRSYRFALPYVPVRGRLCPVLSITFTYRQMTRPYWGIVDSGADRSLCSENIAEKAGVDLGRFPVVRIRGVGRSERARLCPMDLIMLGRRIATEILVIEGDDLVLLGRHDVFQAFQFGFDERAETLFVEPY